jgi:hypothetical protein
MIDSPGLILIDVVVSDQRRTANKTCPTLNETPCVHQYSPNEEERDIWVENYNTNI